MRIDPNRIEVVEEAVAVMLRRKTDAERLDMAFRLTAGLRRLVVARIREEHPAWSDEDVRRELMRRYVGGN